MNAPKPTYEVTNYETLNKFLLGTLTGLRNKTVTIEEADAISKVSDKIIKNNLTKVLYAKHLKDDTPIEFFESKALQI